MEKILPFTWPPIETYQGTSFILGVLLATPSISSMYYNKYINLFCNNTYNTYQVELEFANVSWEDYRLSGVAELNTYSLCNIARRKAVDFIKERIDRGNYMLFYWLDEFYLSYSDNYKRRHFIHDTYVYGYKGDSFCAIAYSEKRLHRLYLPEKELEKALYKGENFNEHSFSTFRPRCGYKEEVCLNKIKKELLDYYESTNSQKTDQGKVYGLSCYDVLIACVQRLIENKVQEQDAIDKRPFRILWEHKKVLKEHLKKMEELGEFENESCNIIIEIENETRIIFGMIIKFNLKPELAILYRVVYYLKQIKQKELLLILNILEILSKNDVNINNRAAMSDKNTANVEELVIDVS